MNKAGELPRRPGEPLSGISSAGNWNRKGWFPSYWDENNVEFMMLSFSMCYFFLPNNSVYLFPNVQCNYCPTDCPHVGAQYYTSSSQLFSDHLSFISTSLLHDALMSQMISVEEIGLIYEVNWELGHEIQQCMSPN